MRNRIALDPRTKTCTKCGLTKSIDVFGNYAAAADGKTARCKACINAARRKRPMPTYYGLTTL